MHLKACENLFSIYIDFILGVYKFMSTRIIYLEQRTCGINENVRLLFISINKL